MTRPDGTTKPIPGAPMLPGTGTFAGAVPVILHNVGNAFVPNCGICRRSGRAMLIGEAGEFVAFRGGAAHRGCLEDLAYEEHVEAETAGDDPW